MFRISVNSINECLVFVSQTYKNQRNHIMLALRIAYFQGLPDVPCYINAFNKILTRI